jgi:hypothetical protein
MLHSRLHLHANFPPALLLQEMHGQLDRTARSTLQEDSGSSLNFELQSNATSNLVGHFSMPTFSNHFSTDELSTANFELQLSKWETRLTANLNFQ